MTPGSGCAPSLGEPDRQRHGGVEPARQAVGEAGGDVLDDEDRDGEAGGDAGEERGERVRAAGRGADPDHGAARRRWDRGGAPAVQARAGMSDHVRAAEQLDAAAKRDRGVAVGIEQRDAFLADRLERPGGERLRRRRCWRC